jgi:hypothetical protein
VIAPLSGVIGCYSSLPEPLQQRRANTIFRDTIPQLGSRFRKRVICIALLKKDPAPPLALKPVAAFAASLHILHP